MEIKIFWKEGCPNCPEAKKIGNILKDEGHNVAFHDIESLNGLTEATIHNVMSTPSIIITHNDEEKKAWRGKPPTLEEIKKWLEDNNI